MWWLLVGATLVTSAGPFLFQHDSRFPRCYELDLENCFREAFLSAIHPPMVRKRDAPLFHNANITILEKRKNSRTLQLCHDVRKFSACFVFPGCSDQTAANIASTQYHMVFGKKLPLHVFLAYRGYGRQLCEQPCSKEGMLSCRRSMTSSDQQEEQGYLLELSAVIGHIQPNRDTTVACERFQRLLINLLRIRSEHCSDLAKCTCAESAVQQGVDGCNLGCEHLLQLDLNELAAALSSGCDSLAVFIVLLASYFIVGAIV